MGETTTIRVPFAQGLGQQTAQEWQDPTATAASAVNGNFTKAGAVDKRLGMEFVGESFLATQGSPWMAEMATGVQALTWSKCAMGAAGLDANGLAGAYSVLDDQGGNLGIGPLPPCSVLRRGLPAATTASSVNTTPTIVDVPDGAGIKRFAFYTAGTSVYVCVTSADGTLIQAPIAIYIAAAPTTIQAIYLPAAATAEQIVVLLWFAGTGTCVGLNVPTTGEAVGTINFPSTAVGTCDICPLVNDPLGRFIFSYQGLRGGWYFQVGSGAWSLASPVQFDGNVNTAEGLVSSATYGSGELVAFAYQFNIGGTSYIRYASFTTSLLFAPHDVASTIITPPNLGSTFYQLAGLTRLSAGKFLLVYFQPLQQLSNSLASSYANTMPQGLFGVIQSGAYTQSNILPLGAYPVAKPFMVGSIPYMPVITQFNTSYTPGVTTADPTYNIAEVSPSEQCTLYLLQFQMNQLAAFGSPYVLPVATVAVRQVDPSFSFYTNQLTVPPPFCSALNGTRFAVGLKTQAEDQTTGQQSLGAAWWAEFRFDAAAQSQLFQCDDVYGDGHIAGGVPFISDGTQTFEDNFFFYPEFASATLAPSGFGQTWGTQSEDEGYLYAVVYKHFDATGQLTRGSPVFTPEFFTQPLTIPGTVGVTQFSTTVSFSATQNLSAGTMFQFSAQPGVFYFAAVPIVGTGPFTVIGALTTAYTGTTSSGAGSTAQVAGNPTLIMFPPCSMTWRDISTNPGQVYAEIYRTVAGGSTLFLIAEVPAGSTGSSIQYIDATNPDASIQTNSILYTTGGVLDCVNPPSFYCQCLHWNRVWGVDETRRTIWFTKAFTQGEMPGYNESNTITFPQDITGLWSLDDKLIIGTATSLFIVYGQGPADNGQGSDLTIPQPIACDAGSVDWRAGVVFPGGLIYRTQTGFMLCDRSLNVSWIGKDVVDTLALFPTVLSSTLVPYSTQVRFLCQAANGLTTVLVYDYLVQKWLQHTYSFTGDLASLMLTGTTPMTPSSYAMLGADGTFWQEQQTTSATAYMDETKAGVFEFVPTVGMSAWFKIQGVNGYQRVRQVQVLYEELDDAGLVMSFNFNYASDVSAPTQSNTWTSAQLDELSVPIVMQHVGAEWNKSMSIQVIVQDTPGTNATNGRGMRFVTLSLEMVQIGDNYRQIPAIGRA